MSITDVKLQLVATTGDETTFSVVVDGNYLGNVAFVDFIEPAVEAIDPYVALWAGPTFCVIDHQQASVRCVERDDETHRVHVFQNTWIVEGELGIDLFDPATLTTVARYMHDEVIMESWMEGDLICFRDFQDRTICLNPREHLQPATFAS